MITPYYEHAGIVIYHGDCREILPGLPKCDLLLTDPPYGIGRLMQGGKNTGHWNQLAAGNPWDMETPDMDPILQSATSAIVWGGNYFVFPPLALLASLAETERGSNSGRYGVSVDQSRRLCSHI